MRLFLIILLTINFSQALEEEQNQEEKALKQVAICRAWLNSSNFTPYPFANDHQKRLHILKQQNMYRPESDAGILIFGLLHPARRAIPHDINFNLQKFTSTDERIKNLKALNQLFPPNSNKNITFSNNILLAMINAKLDNRSNYSITGLEEDFWEFCYIHQDNITIDFTDSTESPLTEFLLLRSCSELTKNDLAKLNWLINKIYIHNKFFEIPEKILGVIFRYNKVFLFDSLMDGLGLICNNPFYSNNPKVEKVYCFILDYIIIKFKDPAFLIHQSYQEKSDLLVKLMRISNIIRIDKNYEEKLAVIVSQILEKGIDFNSIIQLDDETQTLFDFIFESKYCSALESANFRIFTPKIEKYIDAKNSNLQCKVIMKLVHKLDIKIMQDMFQFDLSKKNELYVFAMLSSNNLKIVWDRKLILNLLRLQDKEEYLSVILKFGQPPLKKLILDNVITMTEIIACLIEYSYHRKEIFLLEQLNDLPYIPNIDLNGFIPDEYLKLKGKEDKGRYNLGTLSMKRGVGMAILEKLFDMGVNFDIPDESGVLPRQVLGNFNHDNYYIILEKRAFHAHASLGDQGFKNYMRLSNYPQFHNTFAREFLIGVFNQEAIDSWCNKKALSTIAPLLELNIFPNLVADYLAYLIFVHEKKAWIAKGLPTNKNDLDNLRTIAQETLATRWMLNWFPNE